MSPEELLINAVITTGTLAPVLDAGLNREHFCNEVRPVWDWLVDFSVKYHRMPARHTFTTRFPNWDVVYTQDLDWALERVVEGYTKRQLTQVVYDATTRLGANDLDGALSALQASRIRLPGKNKGFDPFGDWEDVWREVRATREGVGGIPFGFPTFDRRTAGFQRGDLVILAARLGSGKTWQLVKVATQAAIMGLKATFFSLEQSRVQIAYRLQTMVAKEIGLALPNKSLSTGEMEEGAYKEAMQRIRDELKGRVIIHDGRRGPLTPNRISQTVEREQPDIVLVDYVTLLRSNDGRKALEDWRTAGIVSGELLEVAQQHQIPLVAAAQINREGDQGSKDKAPRVSQLAQSDSLGQDASVVVTFRRMHKNAITYSCEKNRHGEDRFGWYSSFFPNEGALHEITYEKALDSEPLP